MKAVELMINDWVRMRRIDVENATYYTSKVLCLVKDGFLEYEPIPLTEDILKANGFEYDEQMNAMIFRFDSVETYIHIEYVFGINRIRVSVDPYRCGYAIDTEIHYVHELQHALRLCGLFELANDFKIE